MSAGFLPLCLLASQVPGPGAVHIVLYVLIIGVLWWGAFGYGMYLGQAMQNGDKRVLKHGVRGTATVLEAKGTHTYIGGQPDFGYGGSRVYRYRLRVELPDRQPYETYASMTNHGLREGDRVQVGVARHNRRRVAVELEKGAPKRVRAWGATGSAGSSRPGSTRPASERAWGPVGNDASITTAPAPRRRDRHPVDPELVLMERPAERHREARPKTPEDAIPLEYLTGAQGSGQGNEHGHPQRHGGTDEGERLRQLSELGRLHKEGVLSDEEFATEKARILGFSS